MVDLYCPCFEPPTPDECDPSPSHRHAPIHSSSPPHAPQVEGVPLGGTAYLSLEDPSEPYLYGTKYTAMQGGQHKVANQRLLIRQMNPYPTGVLLSLKPEMASVGNAFQQGLPVFIVAFP